MTIALIQTVGTSLESGDDLVAVLSGEIRQSAASFVLFLVTAASRPKADAIALAAGLGAGAFEIVEVSSPHNLNDIFEKANDSIRSLRQRGFAPSKIAIDYTSGTKVMGSGAVLAAVLNQCCELRYLWHDGHEAQRVVTVPDAVLAFRDLLLARRLIREMRFQSARDLLARIDRSDLSPFDSESLTALHNVAVAYYHWDNFRHQQFIDTMRLVPRNLEPIAKFLVDDEVQGLVRQIADDLANQRYSPAVFADMINNAERRAIEGKLDDATARVYRALEMMAQWALASEDIDTNDVETRRIPPRYRVNFEAMRSLDDGQVRIGMRKAFELMAILGTPTGARFEENKELAELLQLRSDSILAHGTRPFGEEDCMRLITVARAFFAGEIQGFGELCARLQFRWLREGGW